MQVGYAGIRRLAIVGAGAWGRALAGLCSRGGLEVTLWSRRPAAPPAASVRTTVELAEAADADAVLLAVPTQASRTVLERMRPHLADGVPVLLACKGIERGTGLFPSEILRETVPGARPAVLSGPSFAADVERGLPTAVTLAVDDVDRLGPTLVAALGTPSFRPYLTDDVLGTGIGGAVKNVLAIAAGAVAARGLGASAEAALVSRGFAEMTRFGIALGARPETLAGLSGLGDLVLTCGSSQSRNRSFGEALGRGLSPEDAGGLSGLAEGVWTAPALVATAREAGVEMPIAAAVASVLAGATSIDAAVDALLARPFKSEGWKVAPLGESR